ncbi:MAG TPA: lipopolysaccharide heptosyltransferase I, partial [Epsilonproteobacteria bacterium]|nr:lipopolysaccharide heptosyltransferase I [Campylobacterota bacterium]
MVKIAIVKLSAMGDIVHAMITLQGIKAQLPDAQIDWIVEEGFSGLLVHNPDIDHILPVRLKALKQCRSCLFAEVRKIKTYAKNNYDVVIDLQGLIKSGVLARMLGPAVGFDRHSIREQAASFFYRKSFHIPYDENVIYRNIQLVDAVLGITTSREQIRRKAPFLFFDEEERNKTASFLRRDQKNIIYILGSSWESKIYPREKLATVIKALGENALLVWGSEQEQASALLLADQCDAIPLPRLTLGGLKALISEAALVIGG